MSPHLHCSVVSIFPDYLAPLRLSLVGKAVEAGLITLDVRDLRDWTHDRHRTVDDAPYGGGAGMVMRPDVWGEALDEVMSDGEPWTLVIPTPAGEPFTQQVAQELSRAGRLVFACGRYEGIDARVTQHYAARAGGEGRPARVREISIGDYVLGGGEVAALVIIEAVARLIPGVLGNPESLVEESHGWLGLLEYPVYTRPQDWRGLQVPETLTSGDHARIERWRREQALRRTVAVRPDLAAELNRDHLEDWEAAIVDSAGAARADDHRPETTCQE